MRQRLRTWTDLAGGLVAAALLVAVPTSGAHSATQAQQQELDTLFEAVFSDPSNRTLNLRLIQFAMEIGDYEAAIGSLDRLLFFEPENPTFLLLIGEAYYELKSYVAARGFYDTVAELDAASPAQRELATSMIADIERRMRPSPWRFYAQSGLRYQTNATSGADGLDGVDPSALPQSDWNAFVLGTLDYRQPIGKGAIEARLTTYYADQFEVDRLDIGVAELVVGPRLPVASGENTSLSVKPYGVASGVLLGGDPYLGTYGAGISARAMLGAPLTLEPYFEYRNRNYFNSDDYPTVSTETGDLYTYAVAGNGALGQSVSWYARGGMRDNHAQVAFDSYDEYFVDLSLRFRFAGNGSDRPWLFTPSFSANWTDYDAADPVDAGVTREDFRWKAGARLDVPVHEAIGLGVQVEYRRNESNLARYRYDNLQITSGPTVRF